MKLNYTYLSLIVLTLRFGNTNSAFIATERVTYPSSSSSQRCHPSSSSPWQGGALVSAALKSFSTTTTLYSKNGDDDDDDVETNAGFYDGDGDDDYGKDEQQAEPLLTQEMFQREMLADPIVKRKKKGGSKRYRPLDNRDHLPFIVKDITPDPYSKSIAIKEQAKKNTQMYKEKNNNNNQTTTTTNKSSSRSTSGKGKTRKNLVGMEKGIDASIYNTMKDGSLDRILGQFELDKSTTCGDILEVGHHTYEVIKARCQYKYAGGKKFIMTRKILEVKEINRIATEKYLQQQFQKES